MFLEIFTISAEKVKKIKLFFFTKKKQVSFIGYKLLFILLLHQSFLNVLDFYFKRYKTFIFI